MADQNQNSDIPKNEHGQGFADRPAGEKSRYDPEQEMPDPQQVDKDIQEVERFTRTTKTTQRRETRGAGNRSQFAGYMQLPHVISPTHT